MRWLHRVTANWAIAVAGFLCTFAAPLRAESGETPSEVEVHIVGIYEGAEPADGLTRGGVAEVSVDRPGKEVVLVLTAYEGVTWKVSVAETTTVRKVILGGHHSQIVEGLPKGVRVEKKWDPAGDALPYFYHDKTWRFLSFVGDVAKRTGVKRIASFQGAYRAEEPFLIDEVQDNPKLVVGYPQPTPVADLPDIAKILPPFQTYYYVGDNVSYGEHTLFGVKEHTLRPLPGNVRRIAIDPETKQCYGVSGHNEFYRVDLERKTAEETPLGDGAPAGQSLYEIVFDAKRKRFIVSAYDVHQFSPAEKSWSPFSKRFCTLEALAYSKSDDRFYAVEFETHDEGDVASLIVIDAKGKVLSDSPLKGQIAPGGGWVSTSLVALDGYLVLIVTPRFREEPQRRAEAYTYLISIETGETWLTHREKR